MELQNRDELEDEMLAALILMWSQQRKKYEDGDLKGDFWQSKEDEDRLWLLYWLGAVFVASARQHGLDQSAAEQGAQTWGLGHSVAVLSGMRRHTETLLTGENPAETIFGRARAERLVVTEISTARSAGGDFAKGILGQIGDSDLWFTVPDERRCPYCAALHMQPRNKWLEIYQKVLRTNPQFAVYGEPTRPPAHPNCRCFILYQGESNES